MAVHVRDMEPLVSICMPVYNGEEFLQRAIQSVLDQSYENIEVIIIDDRSIDRSWSIIESVKDPRIVAMQNLTNLGAEGNCNKALAVCSGKYIKLFPQDDLLSTNCLAAQVQSLEAHPDAVLAFCRRHIIGPHDQHYCYRGPRGKSGLIEGDALIRACLTTGANVIGEPGAVLFRRSTAGAVGPLSGQFPYVIDLEYWVRLLQYGAAYYHHEALASFRVSAQQWSVAIGSRQATDFIRFIDTHAAFQPYRHNTLLMFLAKSRIRANGLLRRAFYSLFVGPSSAN